jgi:hypothetical protein
MNVQSKFNPTTYLKAVIGVGTHAPAVAEKCSSTMSNPHNWKYLGIETGKVFYTQTLQE